MDWFNVKLRAKWVELSLIDSWVVWTEIVLCFDEELMLLLMEIAMSLCGSSGYLFCQLKCDG